MLKERFVARTYVDAHALPIVRNHVRRESERRLAKLQLTFGKDVVQNASTIAKR